ncbi:virulence factor BrkB family protein [Enterovibrio sp. 27052020O]|uniref:virulence factor BrkB family protein n=1 Tax=Enterovibrio sp. 27052020O TaxID=3241166 RepID=UPI00388DCE31
MGQILFAFIRHLILRIVHDRMTVNAGYMAYVTLLSLVPLITVVLSALSLIPGFAEAGDQIRSFVLHNFVPASGDALEQYLNQFVANAGKMTAVGVAFLFVVALMLISAIDKSLNYIWRVQHKRAPVVSFSIYWMVLTLGPVLVGSSIGVSSYLGSLNLLQLEGAEVWAPALLRGLPFLLTALAFMGLYTLVPNCRIRASHALVGAISASVLFEFSKKAFAFYATNFPSYELIYGALAVVPLLFVWVYLSWCIVLLGAEITASLGERAMWYIDPESDEKQLTDN